jgi:hypothetical protein
MGEIHQEICTVQQDLRVGLHNKKSAAEKNMGKMMKMRRRNCYADLITKAEGETDRPHYGSCINVNQLLLTFSLFFSFKELSLVIFWFIAVPFFRVT